MKLGRYLFDIFIDVSANIELKIRFIDRDLHCFVF